MAGVFLIALLLFFLIRQGTAVTHDEVYSSTLEDAKLPAVYSRMCGRSMNCMRGHLGEVSYDETYETLTLLPEDRNLELHVEGGRVYVMSASYEIRSANLTQLIEKTEIDDIAKDESGITLRLPIQNLIIKDKEYRLDVTLFTQEAGEIHYYTRIMLNDNNELAEQMLDLAQDFSRKNFNFDEARENTTYVETDGTADDTTLAYTNLKSTFNKLAYNGLKLVPSQKQDLRFCNYDGNTGEVHLHYTAARALSSGQTEVYEISETFTMRMGLVRIYMLNYARDIREVYRGREDIASRNIMLGINDEDEIDCITSTDSSRTYFVATRDLWCINSAEKYMKNIFSFRTNDDSDMVSGYRRHDIRLLKCDRDGNLTFLLYGYMNRGAHEGDTGVSLMRYDIGTDTVSEYFFIPVCRTYESLDKDVRELSYLSDSDIFYTKIDGNFYAIDIRDGSVIVLAQGIQSGCYQLSKSMEKLTWQGDNGRFGSELINIFDMNSGKKQEIRTEDGTLLKAEGFIGHDIVLSIHDAKNSWVKNGVVRSIPSSAVEIMDEDLNILKRYERKNEFVGEISVHDGRVNMQLMKKNAVGGFTESGADTIVSSTATPDRREDIGSYNDDFKAQVFYVQVGEDIHRSKIKVAANTDIAEGGIRIRDVDPGEDNRYSAYGDNEALMFTDDIAAAIGSAYDRMGSVRYHGMTVYCRPAMVTSRIIDNVAAVTEDLLRQREDGELQDLYGITLRQALYYVSIKKPVLAYTSDGRPVALYAYDKTTVSMFDLNTKEREYWNQEEAGSMFAASGGDFSCLFTFE